MKSRPIPRLFLLSTALLAACAGSSRKTEGVPELITGARYGEALELAEKRYRSRQTERTEHEYRMASAAFLLDRGRAETLAGEDDAALATFGEARDLAPDAPQPREWLIKTRDKLARQWFEEAREKHAEDELPAALEAYEKALGYDPEHADAAAGILRVRRQLDYRDGLSDDFYNEALAALRGAQLHLAKSRFSYATRYRHWDEKPVRRVSEVNREIARQMVTSGARLESEGYFSAAETEYRLARALDNENTEALAGYERMQVEAKAHDLLERGEMWLLRGEWDKAEEVLHGGRAMTATQQERFDEVLGGIDEQRLRARYEQALNLERDFRYDAAAAAFQALIDESGYYEDSRARLDTLQATIAEVQELYSRIPKVTGDTWALRELLARIDAKWPEYRDVRERLEALRNDGKSDPGNGGAPR